MNWKNYIWWARQLPRGAPERYQTTRGFPARPRRPPTPPGPSRSPSRSRPRTPRPRHLIKDEGKCIISQKKVYLFRKPYHFLGKRTISYLPYPLCRSYLPYPLCQLVIYKLGFNQNYHTFTLSSLRKIVRCNKFSCSRFINYECFEMRSETPGFEWKRRPKPEPFNA